nr:peptidoglycan DD-metalloendopeptidase family protein [Arenicellales bacterium]
TLLMPYIATDSPVATVEPATQPDQTQIAPQAEDIEKKSSTTESDSTEFKPIPHEASTAETKKEPAGIEDEITKPESTAASVEDESTEANTEQIQTESIAAKVENSSQQTSTELIKSEPPNENDGSEQVAMEPNSEEPVLTWQDYRIKSGDSLARIFKKHNLATNDAIRIANHKDANRINKLMPGQKLSMGYDAEEKLRALSFELPSNKNLLIELALDGSLEFSEVQAEYDKRERAVGAAIESSLFKAGAKAGLDDKTILKLVGIFGWDIDFAMDLRKGDRFTVVFEEMFDGKVSKGISEILAAEFITQERKLHAFRHVNDQGLVEYFDAEGNNLRGTFLRTPMKISRITSGFSKKRLHPILKTWRQHNGVDYAAPRGTPVLATANGRVSFMGNKEGYGKTVVLRHGGKYSTLYAHLSSYKSKLRPGSNVKQGQIIGFVGKTGLATAPHLHYEFRVHGEHRDPLKHESPKAAPIPEQELEEFLAKAHQWMDAMAQHNAVQLAQRETTEN